VPAKRIKKKANLPVFFMIYSVVFIALIDEFSFFVKGMKKVFIPLISPIKIVQNEIYNGIIYKSTKPLFFLQNSLNKKRIQLSLNPFL
jgi:hypothetical protein